MTEPARHGRLDVAPLLELLSALGRHQRSGRLTLKTATQTLTLSFQEGSIRAVSTDDGNLRIGEVLRQLGIVTEEQIEQALALQSIATDPEKIGEVLVDVGYISEADVSLAVSTQIASALNRILQEDERIFSFEPSGEPSGHGPFSSAEIACEPLVLTTIFLAEFWLARVGASPPESLADAEAGAALERDRPDHVRRLIAVRDHITQGELASIQDASRIVESIERVLEHVLEQIPLDADAHSARGASSVPQYRVELVDRDTDIWGLADLTRSARHLLLLLLNGESRLRVLLSELRTITDSPDRAVRELTSAGLIRLEIDQSSDEPRQKRDDENGTVIFRLLP